MRETKGGQLSIIVSLTQFEIARRANYDLLSRIRTSQSLYGLKVEGFSGPMVFIVAKDADNLEVIKKAVGNHFEFEGGRLIGAKPATA